MKQDRVLLAHGFLFTAIAGWSFSPIFIRMLSDDFDVYTLSLTRYLFALGPLLAMSLLFFRHDLVRLLKDPRIMIALGTLTTVMQYTWTVGTYGSTATMAQLTTKVSIVFTIILAYLFFHEERAVIKNPIFLMGATTSFVGVAAVLTTDPASIVPVLNGAALWLLSTALLWAIYNIWSKHLVNNIHPVPLFTVVALYVTVAYVILAFAFGEPGAIAEMNLGTAAIACLSGIVPLSLCHPSYNFAQKHLGSSYCVTFNLLTPLGTFAAASLILPAEKLLPTQMLGGILLLAGTFGVTLARRSVSAAAEAGIVEEPQLRPQEQGEG